MSVYDDVLTAVIDLAEQTELYSKIVIGPMPPENGISIAWGSGNLNTFLDKKAAVSMSAVLNCKNSDQELAADRLGNLHTFSNMRKDYPSADRFQITNIETTAAPVYLGREENNQWLYGSSLEVKFYLRGN